MSKRQNERGKKSNLDPGTVRFIALMFTVNYDDDDCCCGCFFTFYFILYIFRRHLLGSWRYEIKEKKNKSVREMEIVVEREEKKYLFICI